MNCTTCRSRLDIASAAMRTAEESGKAEDYATARNEMTNYHKHLHEKHGCRINLAPEVERPKVRAVQLALWG
jgi:hypothetical protein